ncbi:MAG: prenyltransferase [Solirubrobacteraceae bacterium]|nr:prenyltransferase [Solirubrobacteraceae bacterium]
MTATIAATRPRLLGVAVLPALAGCVFALGQDDARAWAVAPLLLAVALLQAAVHVANDAGDVARGREPVSDQADPRRVVASGRLTIRAAHRLSAGLAASGIGVATLVAAGGAGWPLALLAVGWAAGGWWYAAAPRPLKDAQAGDLLVAVLLGPALTVGGALAVSGTTELLDAVLLGLGPGLLASAALQADDLADIDVDAQAGVTSPAVRRGFRGARNTLVATLLAAYLGLLALGLVAPVLLVPSLTAPAAMWLAHDALTAPGIATNSLQNLPIRLGVLHLATCGLLVIASAST